jgi:hypothetical protein
VIGPFSKNAKISRESILLKGLTRLTRHGTKDLASTNPRQND